MKLAPEGSYLEWLEENQLVVGSTLAIPEDKVHLAHLAIDESTFLRACSRSRRTRKVPTYEELLTRAKRANKHGLRAIRDENMEEVARFLPPKQYHMFMAEAKKLDATVK
jgi:hypothetical protein